MMKFSTATSTAVLVVALMTPACGGPRELHLTAGPEVPAAQSTAKVSSTDNGNTRIELTVQHLALPERVKPGSSVYVVWVRGTEPGSSPQNVGALKVDGDLNGSIVTSTPLRSFELYLTAESSSSVALPTGRSLLYTNVAMR